MPAPCVQQPSTDGLNYTLFRINPPEGFLRMAGGSGLGARRVMTPPAGSPPFRLARGFRAPASNNVTRSLKALAIGVGGYRQGVDGHSGGAVRFNLKALSVCRGETTLVRSRRSAPRRARTRAGGARRRRGGAAGGSGDRLLCRRPLPRLPGSRALTPCCGRLETSSGRPTAWWQQGRIAVTGNCSRPPLAILGLMEKEPPF